MALKEYKDSAIYVTTMLVIFVLSFIYSPYLYNDIGMALLYSGFYGFTIGSGLYFGFQYGYKKMIEKI